MKVLVTGAHFTPAVATVEELKKIGGTEIVYVGRRTTQEGDKTLSVESQVLPQLGVKFIPIIAGRFQRIFTIYTIPSLLKIPIGLIQALYIILSQKPDVILSFGGYVAVPVVITGWLFSIPIIIHEQGLISGLANKISSFFADEIAVSFKEGEFKGEKVILTGNPIRRKIIEKSLGAKLIHPPGVRVVLIMGGNQGSHIINLVVEECLEELLKIAKVYHQTGGSKYQDFERFSKFANEKYQVFKFITKDWARILAESDLIISRAGINTLLETTLLGKPALLIPIDSREQKMNARYFEKFGLTKTLPQSKLSGKSLLENIKQMLKDLNSFKEKAQYAKKVIIPDAAKRLALETVILAKNPGVSTCDHP